jgi:RND family efflux transporter MFP subunit
MPRLQASLAVLSLLSAGCDRSKIAAHAAVPTASDDDTLAAEDSVVDEAGAKGFLGVVLAGETVDIAAKSDGRIAKLRVHPGDRVHAGAVLVTLDQSLLRRRLSVARAELAEANDRYTRRKPLANADAVISKEELSVSRVQVLEQRARVDELAQSLADAEIRAPFDGTVAARFADVGALTAAGRSILRLNSDSVPRVRFAVPPTLSGTLAPGQKVSVLVDGTGEPLVAVVESVAPEVDSAARLVFVLGRLELPPRRRSEVHSGQLARVSVLDKVRS